MDSVVRQVRFPAARTSSADAAGTRADGLARAVNSPSKLRRPAASCRTGVARWNQGVEMKRQLLALGAFSLAAVAAVSPAVAHHSFAMFEPAKMYVWEGTVVQFD